MLESDSSEVEDKVESISVEQLTASDDEHGDREKWDIEQIFTSLQPQSKCITERITQTVTSSDVSIAMAVTEDTHYSSLDVKKELEEQDPFTIKFSLSADKCHDSVDGYESTTLSDYLAMEQSPRSSPLSGINPASDPFSLESISVASPLNEFHVKILSGEINQGNAIPFDFQAIHESISIPCSNSMASSLPLPRLKMRKGGSVLSLNRDMDRDDYHDVQEDLPVPFSKSSSTHVGKNIDRQNIRRSKSFSVCGQKQHLSPGHTIYHVASKSPRRSTEITGTPERDSAFEPHPWRLPETESSHSTPRLSQLHGKNDFISDKSPDFISDKSPDFSPPRGELRSRNATNTTCGDLSNTTGSDKSKSYRKRKSNSHIRLDCANNDKNDSCVTPSPSHSRIHQAVSEETITPSSMHHTTYLSHHTLSQLHHNRNYQVDHIPSLHFHQQNKVVNGPYPPPKYAKVAWSDSLHLAPLPPFVSHQQREEGTVPVWKQNLDESVPVKPLESPPISWNPYGYAQYSPYFNPQLHQHQQHHQSPHLSTKIRYSDPILSSTITHERTKDKDILWQQMHRLLFRFHTEFGHCNIPQGYGVGTEYEGLFEWVMDQRRQHDCMLRGESTTLTPTRARSLSKIGMFGKRNSSEPHSSDSSESRQSIDSIDQKTSLTWSNWMALLSEYRYQHGNVDVPLKYPPNPSLGIFVNRQRNEYRKMMAGKSSSMTKEKADNLERLGFTWVVRESHTAWRDRFEELKAFKSQNGHCNVPKTYSENPSLGYWVNEQRFQYRRLQKKRTSYMTQEKINALNSLDFKWSLRETNGSWEKWMKELRDYKETYGDVDVPLKFKPNPTLGAFVNRQRTERRKLQQGLPSGLNEERIQELDAFGFKWSIRVSRTPWEKRLDELKKFKAEYGHCNVPSTFPKNQPLAYWVFKQRGQYRIFNKSDYTIGNDAKQVCHMTPERIRMLDEIGFEWNPPRRMKDGP